MSFRFFSLPCGLRNAVWSPTRTTFHESRHYASLWTRPPHHRPFSHQFFTRTAAPSPLFRRKLLWLLPLAGGFALLAFPKQRSVFPAIFSSPTLIPCPAIQPAPIEPMILSPAEPDDTHILSKIVVFLRDRIWEPILTARRFIFLVYLFLPVLLSSPMLLVGKPEKRLQGDRWGAVWWYGYLTSQMQRAGPTFIKLAQWAASRADLFSSLLCERLGALHSRGKAHPFSHTKRVVEHVFQRPFDEVFEEFDETPIGSGAIAQVSRGILKKDLVPPPSNVTLKRHRKNVLPPVLVNEPPPPVPTASVAVKILHPHVEKLIHRDLSIMRFFARVITLFPGMQWISLPEEVEVFGRMMHEQLDLRIEANNLEEFEHNFADRKLPVNFPRPLRMWSSKEVLVEEFKNALSLELFLRNGGGPFNDLLAEVGLDAFLNMLLLDNFVHSDLHPGNIMIQFSKPSNISIRNTLKGLLQKPPPAPTESEPPVRGMHDDIVEHLRTYVDDPPAWRSELERLHASGYMPEVVFVDAGLVTTLNGKNRQNFLDLFRAIAEFDGYRAGQLMVERCRTPELAIDPETFALRMQHIVLNVKRKTFSLGQIKISDILTEVLKAVRQHHVKMEGDFVNTVISILLLEGIGRQLDPGLDLFKSALPILRQLGRQMSTQETMSQMPSGDIGAFLKVWVWMEARGLASTAFIDVDELVKYDTLTSAV
ncbi:ABC1-domain-containing protein [Laetiporus sulphureus 93-53]|uniref:ABC1-domain-containing protein n=1 Tax=Laetiporus sulphureus 93-53 TaxID=1314785 RepID=A0A165CA82_9APHY|nr:ABC1-domain-containing protein [Laetiporus sulphureus 93-53]KZT02456.1 ABC1-domain-containing protein [Laetiporus sulphureus 93-53]